MVASGAVLVVGAAVSAGFAIHRVYYGVHVYETVPPRLPVQLSQPAILVFSKTTFDGAQEARLIALACRAPPEGKSRWTLRLLAGPLVALQVLDTVSRECVRQALQKTNLSPI